MGAEGLPRKQRIRGKALVESLFATGRTGVSGPILVRALPNPSGAMRMGAAAGKRLGNAVTRNRIKRRLRAAYRTNAEMFPKEWDLFFIARRDLTETEWPELIRNMHKAAERAISAPTGHPRYPPRR